MKIEYFGHSCFRITNAAKKSVLTDPYTRVGYALPKELTASAVTVSHNHFDHNYIEAIQGDYKLINTVGAIDLQGVSVVGVKSWHDPKEGALRGENLIFRIEIDGLKICHFGDLGEGYSEKFDDILGDADIWLLPVGGTYTIDAMQAKEYVERLQPKCVIPMHYLPEDGRLDITPADCFLKLFDEGKIIYCPQGEAELSFETLKEWNSKILFMERKCV